MAAYILAAGKVFAQLFGISEIFGSIIFFLIFAVTLSFGLKVIEESELGASLIILIFVIFLIILLVPKMSLANINVFSAKNLLVPYGVLMFAFYGIAAIPEMSEELEKNKKSMKKAIITGTIIIALIYAFFSIITVGVTGSGTTEVAVLGLTSLFGPAIFLIGSLFALFALFTSALPISLATKEIFNYDFRVSNRVSFLLAAIIPLALFFVVKEFASFSMILNIVGAINLNHIGAGGNVTPKR
jgi:tyrosine-specific transport protein